MPKKKVKAEEKECKICNEAGYVLVEGDDMAPCKECASK